MQMIYLNFNNLRRIPLNDNLFLLIFFGIFRKNKNSTYFYVAFIYTN